MTPLAAVLLCLVASLPLLGGSPGTLRGDPLGGAGAGASGAFSDVMQSARYSQSLSARAAARAALSGEEGRRAGCNLCGSAAVTHGVLWMDAGEWRAEYCLRCVKQQREDDVVCIRDGDDLQVTVRGEAPLDFVVLAGRCGACFRAAAWAPPLAHGGDNTAWWCEGHSRQGDILLGDVRCLAPGCTKRPRFSASLGFDGSPGMVSPTVGVVRLPSDALPSVGFDGSPAVASPAVGVTILPSDALPSLPIDSDALPSLPIDSDALPSLPIDSDALPSPAIDGKSSGGDVVE
ncbi:hypothetical protein T484DRAFT_2016960, partial [Baffinella frigidus]